jgi:hypothetical protein
VSEAKKTLPLYVPFFIGLLLGGGLESLHDFQYPPEQMFAMALVEGISGAILTPLFFWFFARSERSFLPSLLFVFVGSGIGSGLVDVFLLGSAVWYSLVVFVINVAIVIASYQFFAKKTRRGDRLPPEDK